GEILRAVRDRFGPDMPIGCVLDLHANVTHEMLEYADPSSCYDDVADARCADNNQYHTDKMG
ncbi:MAG: M81 family metallopeptidase, partial [Prevotella sp.]|nr:M81 family metallopeptidase [Prevotella sp.]